MGRRRKHDDRTAAALLDAAEELLQEHGIDGLSVRAVADRVGTTTRAVYTVFGSKTGLLGALGERAYEILGAGVASIPETGDPAADLVDAVVLVFRRFAVDHPALFRLAVQQVATPLEVIRQWDTPRQAAWGLFERRVARLGVTSLSEAAFTVNAMCEGLAGVELRCRLDPVAGERLWREAMAALVAGITRHDSDRLQSTPAIGARPA